MTETLSGNHAAWQDWISWDPSPSRHPWLTAENLRAAREFSEGIWKSSAALELDPQAFRYAFVGNLANYLYMRAAPLRKRGLSIDMVIHPYDRYVMSQPGWEQYEGDAPDGSHDVDELAAAGLTLPRVDGVYSPRLVESMVSATATGTLVDTAGLDRLLAEHPYLRPADVVAFARFMSYTPILDFVQQHDALLATQAVYLAYLSGKPYLAAQGGGDLWLESSRADDLGHVQRAAFRNATAILASNPWTYANARRLGLTNVVYLPLIMDDAVYSPGPGTARRDWEEQTGGSFFVLATARQDETYKGSDLALEGFARFAAFHPGARLVFVAWGEDREATFRRAREHDVADRLLVLPVAGKGRLREFLRSADCLLDQFTLGQYGATALEASACGLPVVMSIQRAQYDALLPAGAPPVLDASTPDEIARALSGLAEDPGRKAAVGELARSWFVAAHGSSTWADTYSTLLAATAAGVRIDFSTSPLAEPLTEDERRYHAEGFEHAPRNGSEAPTPPAPILDVQRALAAARAWVGDFRRDRGRSPRVLHLGNVANNAYLNASLLRRAGVDSDVLSHDYYDPMATPEWETGEPREEWFVQGSFAACMAYLAGRGRGSLRRRLLWYRLGLSRWVNAAPPVTTGGRTRARAFYRAKRRIRPAILHRVSFALGWMSSLLRWAARKTLRLIGFDIQEPNGSAAFVREQTLALQTAFTRAFPDRPDQLEAADLAPYMSEIDRWRDLFSRYDIVQCYSVVPIRALIVGKRPFVAFEHGTLRAFTMGNTPLDRTTALGYHESDHTFVTNGDCLEYAELLRIPHYSPMIHAVDIEQHEHDYGEEPSRLRERFDADVLLFCPVRHDWAIKGTHLHLAALPEIIERVSGRVVLATCDWGLQVEDSKALVRLLGCEENVVWLRPLPRRDLIVHTKASDVVLDQMALPHFGATAPQALAAGTPVVMSYRPESTAWIVSEPAPILPAFTPGEIADAVLTALDPEWRSQFPQRARDWVHRQHHSDRLVAEHIRVYRELVEQQQIKNRSAT